MDYIAEKLTCYIANKGAISYEDFEIYRYGFLIGLEMLSCIATCILVAMQMGMAGKCLLFFAIFFSLRSFVGGFHMESYQSCYAMSCIVVGLSLYFIKNYPFNSNISLVIAASDSLIIYSIKPMENQNRPVNKKEAEIFSKRTKVALAVIFTTVLLFYILDLKMYVNTVSTTLSVIVLSMMLEKIKYYIKIRKG